MFLAYVALLVSPFSAYVIADSESESENRNRNLNYSGGISANHECNFNLACARAMFIYSNLKSIMNRQTRLVL
jgi:hypothetical protein